MAKTPSRKSPRATPPSARKAARKTVARGRARKARPGPPKRTRPAPGKGTSKASGRGGLRFVRGLLSPDAVRQIKLSCRSSAWSGAGAPGVRGAGAPAASLGYDEGVEPVHREAIVAEGDSWFDYPPGVDILNWLHVDFNYRVQQFSHYGDTLENMVYGDQASPVKPTDLLIRAVEHFRPRAFLFSAGGNDIAGPELRPFLNHARSALPTLRLDYAEQVINENIRRGYVHLLDAFRGAFLDTPVFAHGYACPIPDGRSVNLLIWRIAGPWLKPYFDEKCWGPRDARETMRTLIDMFNDMLAGLAHEYPGRFFHVDLRGEVRDADWVNELHVNDRCYRRLARRFQEAIEAATA